MHLYQNEGRFLCGDYDREMSYSNWGPGEPNNEKNEDCVVMDVRDEMTPLVWNDVPCSYEFAFICEMNTGKLSTCVRYWSLTTCTYV